MSEQTLRLLIVDDEESIRKLLADHLMATYNYHVDIAGDGHEALRLLDKVQGRYDVALIDQVLEGNLNGLDLLRKIKTTYPEIQVIIFTGWGMKEEQGVEILRQGAYRYFAKPFNLEELALTIRFAAEEKQVHQERQYLDALVKVGQGLTATTQEAEQLSLAWNFVREQLDVSTFFIGLLLPNVKRIYFPLTYDQSRQINLPDTLLNGKRRDWGLAGYVVNSGEEILWSTLDEMKKVCKARKIAPIIVDEPPASGFCLPLRLGERVRGVLSAQSYHPHIFTLSLQNALRSLGSQLSVAMENSRLFAEAEQKSVDIEHKANSLSTLQGLVLTINSSLKLDEILTKTCQKAVEFFYADHSGLVLFDPNFEQGTVEAEYPNLYARGLKIPLRGIPAEEKLIKTHQYLRIDDIGTAESLGVVRDIMIGFKIQSILIMPVIGKTGLLGSFSLESIQQQRHFSEEEVNLCKTFADQVAVAIENARNFESETRHRQEAETLREAALALSTTLNQEEIFERILSELEKVVPYDSASVQLLKGNRLVIIGGRGFPNLAKFLGLSFPIDGDNPNYQVILRKTPFIVPNAPSVYKGFSQEPHIQAGIHGWLGVPMLVGDRLIGMIALDKREPDFFTNKYAQLAQAFASQAAIAIENARLFTQLSETKEQLDSLIENSFDPMIVIDQDRKIKVFNRRAEELFGWQSEEMLGHTVACLHVDVEKARELFEEVDRGGVVTGRSVELKHRDNTRIPSLLSATVIRDSHNKPVGQAGFIRDLRDVKSRENLLTALDEASRYIRAEKEPEKLLHQIVRLATQLIGCTAGCLFINYPHIEQLEMSAAYGFSNDLIGNRFPYEGLIGNVAKTGKFRIVSDYSDWIEQEAVFKFYIFKAAIGFPLRYAGNVEAVLFIADTTSLRKFDKNDLEILERFAAQASIALHTTYLMNKEQRRFSQLAILNRINDYVQEARDLDKILHAVLTGVTAGYGFGFNRAALLFLDETGKNLVGRMGIGHLNEPEAKEDWQGHYGRGMEDFENYRIALEQGALPVTPVGKNIVAVRIPVKQSNSDALSRIILEQHWKILTQVELDKLSKGFIQAFKPALPFIAVPMMSRGKSIGLLVVDNKFTQIPITEESVESLLTFVNTAAVAIDNVQLFQETEIARKKISASFEASNALVLSQPTAQLLEDIIHRTQMAAGASWVSVVLIDELGVANNLFTTGPDDKVDIRKVIRPDGITMQVMRTGRSEVIEDTKLQGKHVNSRMRHNKVAAALCLPFTAQGRQIGVVWIHYSEPRKFPNYDVEAIQLFVNQAAVAYDNARRMRELVYMRKAADAMASVLETHQVLKQIVESACEVMQADSSAIWSYDNVRNQFIPGELVAYGISTEELGRFRKKDPKIGGTAATVMGLGWVEVTDILDMQYNFMGPSTVELLNSIGAKSFQGVALKVGDEKLGVLYVNYKSPRSFTEEDRTNLETFSYHAALALKKSRLLEQVSKARDAAKVVAQVSVLEDLPHTLNSIVLSTQDALHCDVVTLYTYDQERDKFNFPPTMVGVEKKTGVLQLGRVADQSVVRNILALEKAYEAEEALSDSLMRGPFVFRENIQSSVGIPLRVGDRKVGVMFVNYHASHRFTADESTNIELFANQAAVAIRNAQLFQGEQRYAQALQAIQVTSAAVSAVLDSNILLPMITDKAAEFFVAPATSLMLWDEHKENLVIRAAFGLSDKYCQGQRIAHSVVDNIVGEKGLGPQVFDIHHVPIGDSKFVDSEKLYTVMVAPLVLDKELIGILNVYNKDESHQFEEMEKNLATIFANHAASAIQNARSYEELKRTKGLVGARTALAWMGMANSAWRHAIEGYAINIRNTITLTRQDINKGDIDLAEQQKLEKRFVVIENEALKILEKPITPPLSSEEGAEIILINDLISERLSQLWEDDSYHNVTTNIKLARTNVKVKVSPEWFRRALDILIDNAVDAMADAQERKLTITSRVSGNKVEIVISDTGRGISPELQEKVFKELIEKQKGAKGFGIGLLMVQAIMQAYKGDARIYSSDSNGTTFILSLPIAQ